MTGKENIQLKTPRKVQYLPESVGFIIVTADYNLQALWWFCIAWLRGSSGTSWLALYSHHHCHIMFYIIKLCLCFPPGITFLFYLTPSGDIIVTSFPYLPVTWSGFGTWVVNSLFPFLWLIWTWSPGARLFSFSPLLHRRILFWSRIFVPLFTATLPEVLKLGIFDFISARKTTKPQH